MTRVVDLRRPVHAVCGVAFEAHRADDDSELRLWRCGCDVSELVHGPQCPVRHTRLMRPVRGPDGVLLWGCPDCHREVLVTSGTRPPDDRAREHSPARRYEPGELVRRRARREWACGGWANPPGHAPGCPGVVAPGTEYVEMMPGGVSYFDSHRMSLACATHFLGFDAEAFDSRQRLELVVEANAHANAYLAYGASLDFFRGSSPSHRRTDRVAVTLSLMGTPDVLHVALGPSGRTPRDGAWRRFYDANGLVPGTTVLVRNLGRNRYLLGPGERTASAPAVREIPVERQHVRVSTVSAPADVPRELHRAEQSLVLAFARHLVTRGVRVCRLRIKPLGQDTTLFNDLYVPSPHTLIEGKADVGRASIRMAIGQLADYRRFVESREDLTCAVLVPERPSGDLLELLAAEQIAVIWPHHNSYACAGHLEALLDAS